MFESESAGSTCKIRHKLPQHFDVFCKERHITSIHCYKKWKKTPLNICVMEHLKCMKTNHQTEKWKLTPAHKEWTILSWGDGYAYFEKKLFLKQVKKGFDMLWQAKILKMFFILLEKSVSWLQIWHNLCKLFLCLCL